MFRRKVGQFPPFKPILVGHADDGKPITMPLDQLQYHMHVLGLSGRGKSYELQNILRQLMLNRQGFTLIDPHGSLYDGLLRWIAIQRPEFLKSRKIHLLDPANRKWHFGYNPLNIPDDVVGDARDDLITDKVDALMEAVAQVMGGEDPDKQPRYQKVFSTILYTMAAHDLTVLETLRVIPRTAQDWRDCLCEGLPNPVVGMVWEEIRGWEPREFTIMMESFSNRMGRFLRHPFIRQALGQKKNILDPLRVMDHGEYVLMNLQPRRGVLSWQTARLLARLMMNEYTQTALERVADKSRPHFLVVDEAHHMLTTDTEMILDQTRKFGLHLIVANQRLQQLRQAAESILSGVMEGAQNKIFFGMTHQTALQIVDEFFAHKLSTDRPKHILDKPVQVGFERTYLQSFTDGSSETSNWNSGGQRSSGGATAIARYSDEIGREVTTDTFSDGDSETFSSGGSTAKTFSQTQAEALIPILELMPTAVYSLDEEKHKEAVRFSQLSNRHIIVRYADGRDVHGTTPDVRTPFIREERLAELVEKCNQASGFTSLTSDVKAEIEDRWAKLEQLVDAWKAEVKIVDMPKSMIDRFE